MKSKKNLKTVKMDVIVPLEFTVRLEASQNYPNYRSKVQKKAIEELRRFLGDSIFLDGKITRGRPHSKQVKE